MNKLFYGMIISVFMICGYQLNADEQHPIPVRETQEKETIHLQQGRLRIDKTPKLSEKQAAEKSKEKKMKQGRLHANESSSNSSKPYKETYSSEKNEKDRPVQNPPSYNTEKRRLDNGPKKKY